MAAQSGEAARESPAARWGRRVVTLCLYPALFAAYLLVLPVALPVFAVVDVVRGTRLAATRAFVFFGYYLVCELVGILAAALLWVAYRLVPGVDHARFLRWNFQLQCMWARALGAGGFRIFRIEVAVDDPGSLGDRPLLLLVRHASTADTILAAMYVAERYDIVLRYVLKRELLWDPCLDIVGNRLPNVFVRRGGEDTQSDLAAVRGLTLGLAAGEGILIYPEGTRFSEDKRRRVLAALEKRGDDDALRRAESLKKVLPPRLGGTLTLLERCSSWDVAVFAHAGLEGAASFADLWNGKLVGARVRIRIRVFPGEAVHAEREQMVEWLYERWREVDRFVTKKAD